MARALLLLVALTVSAAIAETPAPAIGDLGVSFDAPAASAGDEIDPGGGELFAVNPASGLSASTAYARLQGVLDAAYESSRGGTEVALYETLSPRVVMVVTDSGMGSGVLVGDSATVVTNWHVVGGYESVGVIYKPADDFAEVERSDVRRASVLRIDQVADLALLRVDEAPADYEPIELGTVDEVPVGSDVHAIGHPTGESWTYTKGIVSQVRRSYEWVTESGVEHRADVIQTQTPINPGNSGGPLISDGHTLVGVNSFMSDADAINFAVSVDEVRRFLDSDENRYAAAYRPDGGGGSHAECAIVQPLGTERAPGRTVTYVDLDCDGAADGYRTTPDDPSAPVTFSVDTSGDQRVDTIYSDFDRDGNVDMSAYDVNGDGRPDMVGYHRNGEMEPYYYEEYR